jgi:hypothetical protein
MMAIFDMQVQQLKKHADEEALFSFCSQPRRSFDFFSRFVLFGFLLLGMVRVGIPF